MAIYESLSFNRDEYEDGTQCSLLENYKLYCSPFLCTSPLKKRASFFLKVSKTYTNPNHTVTRRKISMLNVRSYDTPV